MLTRLTAKQTILQAEVQKQPPNITTEFMPMVKITQILVDQYLQVLQLLAAAPTVVLVFFKFVVGIAIGLTAADFVMLVIWMFVAGTVIVGIVSVAVQMYALMLVLAVANDTSAFIHIRYSEFIWVVNCQ